MKESRVRWLLIFLMRRWLRYFVRSTIFSALFVEVFSQNNYLKPKPFLNAGVFSVFAFCVSCFVHLSIQFLRAWQSLNLASSVDFNLLVLASDSFSVIMGLFKDPFWNLSLVLCQLLAAKQYCSICKKVWLKDEEGNFVSHGWLSTSPHVGVVQKGVGFHIVSIRYLNLEFLYVCCS